MFTVSVCTDADCASMTKIRILSLPRLYSIEWYKHSIMRCVTVKEMRLFLSNLPRDDAVWIAQVLSKRFLQWIIFIGLCEGKVIKQCLNLALRDRLCYLKHEKTGTG